MEHLSVEENFLIAKFMGYDYPDILNMSFAMSVGELHNYHEDWNLLMPVVEKIECLCDKIGGELSNHSADQEHLEQPHVDNHLHWKSWSYHRPHLSTDINKVWKEVVSFLQWYITQTKTQN